MSSCRLDSEIVIIDEWEDFVSDVAGLHDVDGSISAWYCGRGPVYRVEDRGYRGQHLELSGGAATERGLALVRINLHCKN